jgi:hypothetical protein
MTLEDMNDSYEVNHKSVDEKVKAEIIKAGDKNGSLPEFIYDSMLYNIMVRVIENFE